MTRDIQLTTTQALVRYLANQYIEIDGGITRLCGGGFGIFGHGNVTCLGEALHDHKDDLPLWRGQNEQSMALAACGYAKYHLRQRFMFATASAGPGTTNLLTASALAHTNRLPLLMLCGDYFLTRLPDPVLQQVEHFNNPTLSVNEAFQATTRYWDRITHPAQIIQAMPNAINTMIDPADCGPTFLALPQDVQGWVYDFPARFFEPKTHHIRRQAADPSEIKSAAEALVAAQKPVIIAGGGVQYSKAHEELLVLAEQHQIPVVETIAGRANLIHDHPLNIGPLGTTGSNSANDIVGKADLIIAIGTRLQDFTTGSWTVFDQNALIINMNVGRFDATKHGSLSVVGDAKTIIKQFTQALGEYKADQAWCRYARNQRESWDEYVHVNTQPNNSFMSYAQVVGAVNRLCDAEDRVVTAAGGLPAEVCANWKTLSVGSVDIEFGYSCMGYEIAGAWGARIAQLEKQSENSEQGDTIVFVGDGSYLMMNSDIYSSVLTGKKLIIIVCDNGGFAVINKLQNNTGHQAHNNLIKDCNITEEPFSVDFAAHAAAMGALSETVQSITELGEAFKRAKAADKTYVISLKTDPYEGWTAEGHAWWEVGLLKRSEHDGVNQARDNWEKQRSSQRKGV